MDQKEQKDQKDQKQQKEEINKAIRIIYDSYEECNDGKNNITWRKVAKSAIVPFSAKTTVWSKSNSYVENMEAMIIDIMENGFVFVNDKTAISFFDIHQFMAYDENDNGEKNKPKESKQIVYRQNRFKRLRSDFKPNSNEKVNQVNKAPTPMLPSEPEERELHHL